MTPLPRRRALLGMVGLLAAPVVVTAAVPTAEPLVDLSAVEGFTAMTRAERYRWAVSVGWMTVNEVRRLEGLPPT